MSNKMKIIGVGSYLPKRIISNFELEKIVDTTNDWIVKRTGINNRHIAEKDETASDMAVESIKEALKNSNTSIDDIDLIICSTTTPEYTFPSTACVIHKKLGIRKPIIAFDIQAVCCGFVYALSLANDMMKNNDNIKQAIVVGTEKMSSIVDWNDRTTCVLFGDGAGSVVLQKAEDDKSGIIDTYLCADGNGMELLYTNGGVSYKNRESVDIKDMFGNVISTTSGVIKMNGQGVFKNAVEKMASSMEYITKKNGYKIEDIGLVIPHQANYRILSFVSEKLGIPNEKFVLTIGEHANTSSASIPLALYEVIKSGKVKRGDLMIFEALGAGLTWGSVLLRW